MNHYLVTQLRNEVAEELRQERRRRTDDGRPALSTEDERMRGRSLIARALQDHHADRLQEGVPLPSEVEDVEVIEAVHAALFGLGRLQPLMAHKDLVEINVKGCDEVWLEFDDGRKERGDPVADSDEELIEWVRTLATYSGLSSRPWDMSNKDIEFQLPDGSRLVGVMGLSSRPVLSIRLYRRSAVSLDDLRELGDYDHELQRLLAAIVAGRMNVMISGMTGSGKTTLLRAMAHSIPPHERIITVEHFLELGLDDHPELHFDVVALEERTANSEGEGRKTIGDLVRLSRRLNPQRIIVGEVLGEEVLAMLDAMSQGNDGGITTIHARSSRQVPERIAQYATREGLTMEAALLLVGNAVDFIVHVSKATAPDGRTRRWVSSVVEVTGFDGVQVIRNEVYATAPGEFEARPAAPLSDERRELLTRHGYTQAQGGLL